MKKKKETVVSFDILESDQKSTPENQWKYLIVKVYEGDKVRIFVPYSIKEPEKNPLVSASSFEGGENLVIFKDRPYVDVDFIIKIHKDLKHEDAVTTFTVIKDNALNVKKINEASVKDSNSKE